MIFFWQRYDDISLPSDPVPAASCLPASWRKRSPTILAFSSVCCCTWLSPTVLRGPKSHISCRWRMSVCRSSAALI